MNKSISSHALVKFLLLFLVVGISDTVEAQQALTPYSDQNKLIRAPQAATQLGSDLFGDTVNLYTGKLEFIQSDVSLAGNSTLPVAVGRHIQTGQDWVPGALFGRWDIEIPHLHGVFSAQKGWTTINGTTARCSQFSAAPDATSSNASWKGTEYWHGSFLYVPGIGDQEMLQRSASYSSAPTANSSYVYPIVTRKTWAIRCLPNMATGNDAGGEAFIAVSPDGTEYRFDWLVSRSFSPLLKASSAPESASAATAGDASTTGVPVPNAPVSPQLSRVEIWILPTRVTDRYGNEVIYTYDTTNKWQLKSISSNESSGSPRTITLTYETPGSTVSNLVSSVSDGTRTWRYSYNGDGALQTVTLPDGSAWQLGGIAPLLYDILYLGSGSCDAPGYLATSELTGTMTHPSGATGNFTLTPT
nr:RHS repeat domain-containing protein [uncultured Massilia sp.]